MMLKVALVMIAAVVRLTVADNETTTTLPPTSSLPTTSTLPWDAYTRLNGVLTMSTVDPNSASESEKFQAAVLKSVATIGNVPPAEVTVTLRTNSPYRRLDSNGERRLVADGNLYADYTMLLAGSTGVTVIQTYDNTPTSTWGSSIQQNLNDLYGGHIYYTVQVLKSAPIKYEVLVPVPGTNGSSTMVWTTTTNVATAFLDTDAFSGETILGVDTAVAQQAGFKVGDEIVIEPGSPRMEINGIKGFGTIDLNAPLMYNHPAGSKVITKSGVWTTTEKPADPCATKTTTTVTTNGSPCAEKVAEKFEVPSQRVRGQSGGTIGLTGLAVVFAVASASLLFAAGFRRSRSYAVMEHVDPECANSDNSDDQGPME